ncbi:AAA family ATPase [Polymorphobacter sp.]|uniref:AAA family ATPase n=1 Tax=Polymorphobacter sp. TaxID=1909290 RepID=UPI003F7245C2
MGEMAPLSLADRAAALRVTIVLAPGIAALLDIDQLVLPGVSMQLHAGSLASFTAQPALVAATDILVAQLDPDDAAEVAAFEAHASRMAARMPVVAAVRDLTVTVMRRLLKTGIADVMPLPFTPEDIAQALENAREAARLAQERLRQGSTAAIPAATTRRQGRIISFLGALGGVGTTSLVTQLGVLWAADKRVCLIDLDVQFGNAALYLNLRPKLTVADLIDAGDRLDSSYLASVAELHTSGLHVIAAPTDIVPLDMLTPQAIERLFTLASETWDIVLVDLPAAWINWSAAALTRSDAVVLVSEMSVAGVHQARRQLEMIDANGLQERVQLAMNRVTTSLFRKADMTQTEQALKRKVAYSVANDYPAMSSAIDEGRPVAAIKVRSRIEKDLRAMLAGLDTAPAVLP